MKFTLCTVLLFIASAWSPQSHCEELLMRSQLKALPEESKSGLIPRLEVEWSSLPVDEFGLLVTFHTYRGAVLYNPFGYDKIGSPYQILLTDSDGDSVYEVITGLPANRSIPDPTAWIGVYDNRIIGRRFWRNRDWTPTKENELPRVPSIPLTEGTYFLLLVVTERLETVPPFSENPTERAKAQSRWRSNALNRYAYRSRPVAIQIGPDGKIRRPAIDRLPLQEDTPVRVTTTLKNGKLEFEAILICDEDRWCKDPGLHGNSRVEINATPRHFESRTGKGFPYRPEEYQQLPKDVILGIRDQYDRLIEPGTYEISVTFPANLWLDDVRNPGPLTGKTKITVEQKDLLDLPDKAP